MGDHRSSLSPLEGATQTLLSLCTPKTVAWNYENGLALLALWRASRTCFGGRWDEEVRNCVDVLVGSDGSIPGYRRDEYNLDQINAGKIVLELWKVRGERRYRNAVELLLGQLAVHPRTPTGSFWHKKIYPNQVWLDGLYMFGPFYAACGVEFDRPEYVEDVCAQLLKVGEVMRDAGTGLYFHAWDESGAMPWAAPGTRLSPHVWGRAVGWLSMALVDVLELLPPAHASRAAILSMFQDLARAIAASQDASGLWWQVMDRPGRPGNYLETSASAMFSYALYKGQRLGYLPEGSSPKTPEGVDYRAVAGRALERLEQGKISLYVSSEGRELLHLGGICKVAGLGGHPYRDGSYEYYLSEPVVSDDYKGLGPFVLALTEAMEPEIAQP